MFYNNNVHIKRVGPLLLSLLLIGGILACASIAKTYGGLGGPADPVPFMAGARTGELPNGLRYYILENAKPENRAYLTLAVNAGSVLEQDDEQGLAHFVEHMAFNGTVRFPESELVNYLRSLGMRFGPEVNAYTTFDETVYGIEVPTELDEGGHKRIPDTALAVIDDWTHRITFDPKDVDDERLIIMEEYRSRLGAMERIRQQLLPIIFRGSPYADRRPIGLPEIIEQAPAEKLQNFYKTWYRGDNMALIFVGDFDGAALEASLTSHFSMPAPDTPLNRPHYDLPAPKKGMEVEIFTDPELSFTRVELYYKRTPKAQTKDLASYREGVIDYLIDHILSTRFDDAARKPETPYVGAWGGNVRYGASSRYYILFAQAKTGSTEASFREILREKESMSRYGFTQAELDRAKRSLISNLIRLNAEKDRWESQRYVHDFTNHFLNDEIVTDIAWELDAVQKLLPGIGLKELAVAVKDYFASEDLTIFLLAPESEQSSLPSKDLIRQLVAEARKAKIARPKSEAVTDQFLDEEPQPGAILNESVDPETGAVLWELSNGAQVVLKETANQNDEIILYALAQGGTTSAPEAADRSAQLAAEMLQVSGIGPYSLPDLQKKLAGKQVAISFWTSPFIRGFQGSSTAGDLKTFFELLYLAFTQPRIDNSAVQAMLDQYRTTLIQQKENPEALFSQEIQRILYGNHPRFAPLEVADLDQVKIDDALSFIQKSLNPGDYTFVFTGNLKLQDLRSYTETYLASIPQGQRWNTWTNPGIVRPGKLEKQVYKGKEERSTVYMGRYIPVPYAEEAAAVLQEYLDIRLTEEIREKRGGVYSIAASVSLSPFLPDGELGMMIYFGCDPKRVEELTAAVEQEIQRVIQEPVDQGIFSKAVEALKKDWETSIQSNSYIAQSYANSRVIYELPLSRLNKRPALYQGLTPQAMQDICRQLLQQGPMVVILYPESRKP
jgi:zinc protease